MSEPTQDPLDAYMKRTSAREMFRLADAYLQAAPSGARVSTVPFVVLPRFDACIRLDAKAIRLFFAHLHRASSWRARAFRAFLLGLAAVPRRLARSFSGVAIYDPAALYPDTDWTRVDVLLAEWQFVGVFSESEGVVSHVLTASKYERCFRNEVEAREVMRPFVPLPETLRVEREGARGWTESFFPNEAMQEKRRAAFAELQRAMCRAYTETGDRVSLADYLTGLETLRAERYLGGNEETSERLQRMIAWARGQGSCEGVGPVLIARGHGDFNLGQVLVSGDECVLIDWSESETGLAIHDYVQSALWSYGWRDLTSPIDVPDLYPMRDELATELARVSPLLAIVLVLIEIGVKQHVDYNAARGSFPAWRTLVDHVLRATGDQNETAPHLRDDLPAQS